MLIEILLYKWYTFYIIKNGKKRFFNLYTTQYRILCQKDTIMIEDIIVCVEI